MIDQQIVTEFYEAVAQSRVGRVEEILASNPGILDVETPNGSWLHVAAGADSLKVVKLLLDSGQPINREGGFANEMPISQAAINGNVEIVGFLLENGAVLDETRSESNPLIGAIYRDRLEVVRLLVENGANVHVKYGEVTPVSFAQKLGRSEIVKFLLKAMDERSDLNKPALKHEEVEPVISFGADDSRMKAAVSLAREGFSEFTTEIEKDSRRVIPVIEECLVIYAFPSSDPGVEVEHLYLSDIHFDEGELRGYVASEMQTADTPKVGDLVPIEGERVTDWLYLIEGSCHGGATIQLMWETFTKEEQVLYGDKPPYTWIKGRQRS